MLFKLQHVHSDPESIINDRPRKDSTSQESSESQDSKNARLLVTRPENHIFVRKGGTKIQLFRQNQIFFYNLVPPCLTKTLFSGWVSDGP